MQYRTYQDVKAHKPVRWWHEAIVDDMLAFPMDTLAVRGARLQRSAKYLSMIINSDMFQAMYKERRAAYVAALESGIAHKTAQVADKALTVVLEALEKKRDSLPFDSLVELTDRTLSRLGYGVKPAGTSVNVNVLNQSVPVVDQELLASARSALRAVETQRTIEHRPEERPDPPSGDASEPESSVLSLSDDTKELL